MTAPMTPATSGPATFVSPALPHAGRSVGWFVALCLALAAGGAALTATIPAVVPFLLALVPAAIAFAIAWREGNGALGRMARLLWTRPASRRWYLVITIPFAWALATVAIGVALGRSSGELFKDVLPSALIVPLVVLLPAITEEIAWRGFAVPRLMTVMSPLRAALLLSMPWVVMHVVLQIPGGINAGAELWPTVVALVSYSVILTWVFVGTGGSVIVTALVHAGLNGVVPLMRGIDADASWAIRAVLAAVIAIAIVALGGLRPPRRVGNTGSAALHRSPSPAR
jgi:uncharacterized protein